MYYPTSLLLLLSLSLLCIFSPSHAAPSFKIGIVRDLFLKYAQQDELIYNGTVWWAKWINQQGGIQYNGTSRLVEVVQEDASTPDPNKTVSFVAAAYEKLISTYGTLDLIMAPSSTERTSASISVSQKYGIINFVVGAQADSLFRSTSSFVFASATPSANVPPISLGNLVAKGAKNYVIFMRPDSIAVTAGLNAMKYLDGIGLIKKHQVWLNTTFTDTAALDTILREALSTYLSDENTDIFIYASLSSEFAPVVSAMDHIRPSGLKAAVFLTGASRYSQRFNSLKTVGNYWLSTARFDPSFEFGVTGQYGGITAEFVQNFTSSFGVPPSSYDAIAPATLMGFLRAVRICNCIDAPTIRSTMKNMTEFSTFGFPLKYQANGTNLYPQNVPIQFINGEGRLVTHANLVYPIPWNTGHGLNSKIIVVIVVPIGIFLIAVVIGGVAYAKKQRQQAVKALVQAEEGERRNYKIDYSALTVGHMIGSGGFGYVYKGEYRGADVAVKKLKVQKMPKQQLDQFAQESSVMIGLRHPNILLFMGVCLESPELCIITEFMSRGSLHDVIQNDKIHLPFPMIKSMVVDVLKGLQFIHSAGIIHRDLKSPNLLVDRSWNIKIADFGLSSVKNQFAEEETQVSLLWTAPEILKADPGCYSEKSDIYSVAIIIWELLARKTPFTNLSAAAISPAVVGGQRPHTETEWHTTLSDMMKKCWSGLPENRPTVREARTIVEAIYIDPDFEVCSSSSLEKYVDKLAPPTGNVTFAHVSVMHTAKLWEHDPRVMMRALMMFNELIRKLLQLERGYEVKSSGDSFMIAFGDVIHATNFCLRTQSELLYAEWPDILLRHPYAAEQKNTRGAVLFRGLTVKMGMHTTNPTNEKNANTGLMDYFGPYVTSASRLASEAGRGQILIAAETYTKVMAEVSKCDAFSVESVGTHAITKGGTPCTVYQMTPQALSERNEIEGVMEFNDETEGETPGEGAEHNDNSTHQFEFAPTAERWIIKYEDLRIGEKIGAGTFGDVKAGAWKNEKVAIKQFVKQKVNDSTLLELRAESALLSMMDHPNVIQFKGMCLKVPNLCLVMEFMEKGSLSHMLHNAQQVLTWDQKKKMARDVIQGMTYLHSKSIIHRDVKSSNLLVSADYSVKIADFGFSRIKADNQTMTQCGTVAWTAPEIFEGSHYSEKADVFSFGIILWELIFRKKPWDRTHSMKVASLVTVGKRPSIDNMPADTPQFVVSLMEACWAQDPSERPTFESMLNRL